MPAGINPSRRRWLRGEFAPPEPVPRLPWLDSARFFARCTRCGECARACPEGIVISADGGYPAIDFARGGCIGCGACAEACPERVFAPRATLPWPQRVAIGTHCLTLQRVFCLSCRDACQAHAIRFAPAPRTVPQPRLDEGLCTRCGACVGACPVGAIAWVRPAASAATESVHGV